MARRLTELPRAVKRLIVLGIDGALCVVSVNAAFYLRLGYWVDPRGAPFGTSMAAIAIALPIFVSLGLYRAIFRYAGWQAIAALAQAVSIYAIPFSIIYTLVGIHGTPRTVGLIQPILLLLLVGLSRLAARGFLGEIYRQFWTASALPQVLIYGAGSAGRAIASAIASGSELRLIGFVDDDPHLWRSTIDGKPVFRPVELPQVVKRRGITDILLAIPSATRAQRADIVHSLHSLQLHVRTLPGLMDMATGKVSTKELRDLEIEDLLGRPAVPPDVTLLKRNIEDKVVLVTGAGGSIGGELCRQIANLKPRSLLLLDHSEFNLYAIHQELTAPSTDNDTTEISFVPLIASIDDARRIGEIFAHWKPDTVFHAAAYKHVPLVEQNVIEGIANNVFGTYVVAQAALAAQTRSFTLISSDKAVRPTNIMGASKRVAEMILQAFDSQSSNTIFSSVRFGNVLGSSGSVVPLFRKQIANGGPVTLTHPDVTRFFMTIAEAAQLVIQAGAMARGGDVFLLDMGQPVRIYDLAKEVIELSGSSVKDDANPNGEIEIRIVGLRPGEKLYEELLIGKDPESSEHPRIMRSKEPFLPFQMLMSQLAELQSALDRHDAGAARSAMRLLVPEFTPSSPLVDLLTPTDAVRDCDPKVGQIPSPLLG